MIDCPPCKPVDPIPKATTGSCWENGVLLYSMTMVSIRSSWRSCGGSIGRYLERHGMRLDSDHVLSVGACLKPRTCIIGGCVCSPKGLGFHQYWRKWTKKNIVPFPSWWRVTSVGIKASSMRGLGSLYR
jgi:hypothetical protein